MKRIPFRYRLIQGAIGKRFVIKHYRGGKVVMTRYPDMSGIIPSEEQKAQRRHFKRAVAYAKKVYANPALREEKRRLLRKPKRLFQTLIKEWFAQRREKDFYRQHRINRWQRNWQMSRSSAIVLPGTHITQPPGKLFDGQMFCSHIRLCHTVGRDEQSDEY